MITVTLTKDEAQQLYEAANYVIGNAWEDDNLISARDEINDAVYEKTGERM